MPPTMPEPDALDQMMFGSVGIGRREAALAAADRVPHGARDDAAAPGGCCWGRGTSGSSCLLPRTLYGISLSTVTWYICALVSRCRSHVRPAVDRDRQALVVRHDHAVRVGRVDPDVVVIAAGRLVARHERQRLAAVDRARERRREEVRLVLVVRGDRHARVVVRAPHRQVVVADHVPALAAVVAAEHLAGVRLLAVPRRAVAGLDERVDAVGVRVRDRDGDLADGPRGQAVAPSASSTSRRRRATCRARCPGRRSSGPTCESRAATSRRRGCAGCRDPSRCPSSRCSRRRTASSSTSCRRRSCGRRRAPAAGRRRGRARRRARRPGSSGR